MAKYECKINGDFDQVLTALDNGIVEGSISASYEDGSDIRMGDTRLSVRVYERYSWSGGNRVSLNVTLLGKEDHIFITAITSGGSQAMFFKLNTFGEEAFLDCVKEIIDCCKNT